MLTSDIEANGFRARAVYLDSRHNRGEITLAMYLAAYAVLRQEASARGFRTDHLTTLLATHR